VGDAVDGDGLGVTDAVDGAGLEVDGAGERLVCRGVWDGLGVGVELVTDPGPTAGASGPVVVDAGAIST
jgi:hypothetical protein